MKIRNTIKEIHLACSKACHKGIGKYLPVAGNVGIFCQNEDDFNMYDGIRKEITHTSNNPDQKYFELIEPIVFEEEEGIPGARYTHLYIRKPAEDSPEKGDVDFVLPPEEYMELKESVVRGELPEGVTIYDRPGWDNIEIRDPEFDGLAYVSTQEMAEKVRVRF